MLRQTEMNCMSFDSLQQEYRDTVNSFYEEYVNCIALGPQSVSLACFLT